VQLRALLFLLPWPLLAAMGPVEFDQAFGRLYNFDFAGSHAILDGYIARNPQEPLPYAMRASVYLFHELDRLSILESEFFSSDKRIVEKKKLKPDPAVRARLFAALADAQTRAEKVLETDPVNRHALFAMCIVTGVTSDYTALVEKRQLSSLSHVRRSTVWANRLLRADPNFYDAHLCNGVAEYILGSLPFFIRWFVRIDDIQGSKEQGMRNVELVAKQGHYFKPFAKILLGIAYLREKRPHDTKRLLTELARDYPSNPLFKKELAKISQVR
jgi:hypothetical protein